MIGATAALEALHRREAAIAAARYTRVAAALHWGIGLLVLGMLALGYYMVEVPRQTPLRKELFNLHKSLGLLTLALMLARLAWRLRHTPPPLPADIPALNRWVASATHVALYALLLAQPLSGYVSSVYGKYGVRFFGLELPAWGRDDPLIREPLLAAHHLLAALLVVLVVLHVAGALWHAARGRPDILDRMWPFRRPTRKGLT